MKTMLVPLALIATLSACQPRKPDSPEELKAVIVAYFDCISKKDFTRMKSLTTSDFIIYENGKVINNDGLIDIINKSPIAKATYSFDGFTINVDNASGNMRYSNHGEFVKDDASLTTRDWLESATFKKVGDEWKLDFIHSTVKK
ncbi:nuclear transport factor 2 family protein [Sorangium sp. So ce385]|uniref:nuclear transport factor 2 family protein n=1 Tax=Sorangium sp. So ce385 TaxID=3133308 RepID=UPI003F5C3013